MNEALPDYAKIPVKCPKCGRSSQFKVGRLRHSPHVKCPTCWATYEVETSGIDRGVCTVRQSFSLNLVETARLKREQNGRISKL
jgi:transposase-like protein